MYFENKYVVTTVILLDPEFPSDDISSEDITPENKDETSSLALKYKISQDWQNIAHNGAGAYTYELIFTLIIICPQF